MNHQFKYSNEEDPSFPLVDILVSKKNGISEPEKGKIDTGSPITVIPEDLIKTLILRRKGKVEGIGSFGSGVYKDYDAYFVKITIGSTTFNTLKVIAEKREHVLIGRDLINIWNLKLNGEKHTGEISHWSTNPKDAK